MIAVDCAPSWMLIWFNPGAAPRLTPRVVDSLIKHWNVTCSVTCSWLDEIHYGEPKAENITSDLTELTPELVVRKLLRTAVHPQVPASVVGASIALRPYCM
jgi:hypothetical protein